MINKIYFLHIPKTAGRFFLRNVFYPIRPIIKLKGVDIYEKNSHPNWDKEYIDDNTYMFSIFREPAERTVSQYVHHITNNGYLINNYTSKNINRESFLKWSQDHAQNLSNYQAKCFIDETANDGLNFEYDLDDSHIELFYNRINRVDRLIRNNQLSKDFLIKLQNEILEKIGSKHRQYEYIVDRDPAFKNTISGDLYSTLKLEDVQWLNNLSYLDYKIYTDNSKYLL